MSNTIRVALPGYNALTDTDPDHFALYGDEDWVLIKEFSRGSGTIGATGHVHITHDLGYVPLVFCFAKTSGDIWTTLNGEDIDVSTTELILYLSEGIQYKYYIFYDDQV
jgi:hypothetical protein